MKIVILQGAFLPVPPILGGAVEKMWFALGSEFAKKGHDVLHISREYPGLPKEEWLNNVYHKRITGYNSCSSGIYLKFLDFLYTFQAKKVIPKDVDVVITNTFWAPILLPSSLQRKCMVDVERMPKGQMIFYKRSFLRANSMAVAKAVFKELKSNFTQIITIPNPLGFRNFPSINLKTKKQIILYVGRIHPEKGLELLIEGFKKVDNSWKLQIVGPSEIKAGGGGVAYLDKLKRRACNFNIEFVGPVFKEELLRQIYEEASIFVYPSIAERGETFGLAPLEAMAFGCVPVVSSLDCFSDFIHHEQNGLIFDHRNENASELLSDILIKLQQNRDLLNTFSKRALNVQSSHSVSYISKLFLEQFERIISHNKS